MLTRPIIGAPEPPTSNYVWTGVLWAGVTLTDPVLLAECIEAENERAR